MFRSPANLQQSSKQRIPHTKALQNRIVFCPCNLVACRVSFCNRVLEEVKLSLFFPFLSLLSWQCWCSLEGDGWGLAVPSAPQSPGRAVALSKPLLPPLFLSPQSVYVTAKFPSLLIRWSFPNALASFPLIPPFLLLLLTDLFAQDIYTISV